MEPKVAEKVFQVSGMSCPSCELKIENILKKIAGVKEVKASLAKSTVEDPVSYIIWAGSSRILSSGVLSER